MAISQIQPIANRDAGPKFKDTDDVGESARWEAYCALQAKKGRNVLQTPIEQSGGFSPVADRWGGRSTVEDRSPAHDLRAPDRMTPTGGAEPRTLDAHGFRGRTAAAMAALAVLAGGLVVGASLLPRLTSFTHAEARRDSPVASTEPRSARASLPAAQPVISASPAIVPTEAPRRESITRARPRGRRPAIQTARARDDRLPQARQKIISREMTFAKAQRTRAAKPIPKIARRSTTGVKTAWAPAATRSNAVFRPESQTRETAVVERPAVSQRSTAASQRITEYRASQAEYERQLKSYDQAMERYHAQARAAQTYVVPRSTNPSSALDSLPWRQ